MTKEMLAVRGEHFLERTQCCTTGVRLKEVAGGATAEFAAVCCCCPCALADFLVLFLYKVPTGLCRRALRRRRLQRLLKSRRAEDGGHRRCQCRCCDAEVELHPVFLNGECDLELDKETEKEVMELEKEMWERFYSTGFWRSPSQREDVPIPSNG